jgi:hypothetical protein
VAGGFIIRCAGFSGQAGMIYATLVAILGAVIQPVPLFDHQTDIHRAPSLSLLAMINPRKYSQICLDTVS